MAVTSGLDAGGHGASTRGASSRGYQSAWPSTSASQAQPPHFPSSTTDSMAAPGPSVAASGIRTTPFLTSLRAMVDNSIDGTIGWSSSGQSVVVINEEEFANVTLPKFIKTKTFASFARQLNLYGFRKVTTVGSRSLVAFASRVRQHEFAHPNFVRGQPNLMSNIKRKETASTTKKQRETGTAEPANDTASSPQMSAASLDNNDTAVSLSDVMSMRNDIRALQEENRSLTRRVQQQQDTLDRLVSFFNDYVARAEAAVGEHGWQEGQGCHSADGSVSESGGHLAPRSRHRSLLSGSTSQQQPYKGHETKGDDDDDGLEHDDAHEHSESRTSQCASHSPDAPGKRHATDQHQRHSQQQQQQQLPMPAPGAFKASHFAGSPSVSKGGASTSAIVIDSSSDEAPSPRAFHVSFPSLAGGGAQSQQQQHVEAGRGATIPQQLMGGARNGGRRRRGGEGQVKGKAADYGAGTVIPNELAPLQNTVHSSSRTNKHSARGSSFCDAFPPFTPPINAYRGQHSTGLSHATKASQQQQYTESSASWQTMSTTSNTIAGSMMNQLPSALRVATGGTSGGAKDTPTSQGRRHPLGSPSEASSSSSLSSFSSAARFAHNSGAGAEVVAGRKRKAQWGGGVVGGVRSGRSSFGGF